MMPEISLNILDVAENSVRAKASLIEITVSVKPKEDTLSVIIRDDGCGMTADQVKRAQDPFFTTRTTRIVGLGLPFFKQAAESTGGTFRIDSEKGKGTTVEAVFILSHIDRMPLGDISSTIHTLIVFNEQIDFKYTYEYDDKGFILDTREMREMLGDLSGSIWIIINRRQTAELTFEKRRNHMKSLEELRAIRAKMQGKVGVRAENENQIRVVVGMATCGIASGARPVLTALSDAVQEQNLSEKICVTQTGCIGLCQYEPIVEVMEPGKEKVTYVKMTPEKALEVLRLHLLGGQVVTKYTLGAAQNTL